MNLRKEDLLQKNKVYVNVGDRKHEEFSWAYFEFVATKLALLEWPRPSLLPQVTLFPDPIESLSINLLIPTVCRNNNVSA